MPLPTKDAITFRGIPSCGDKATIALSLKLTQKQVEAIFSRQESINKRASTQFPLEIDFDKSTLYIGDTTTSFNSGNEIGTREVYRRIPSLTKPLAGMFLSATVIGKLIIPRELDEAASELRKATEIEQTKKNKRGIIRIDAPTAAPKGKKSRPPGVVSQTKQVTTRVVSSQSNSTAPHPNVNSNSSKLPSSHISSLSTAIPITAGSTRSSDSAAGLGGAIYSNIKSKEATPKLSVKRTKVSTSKRRLPGNDGPLNQHRLPLAIEESKAKAKVESSLTPTFSTVPSAPISIPRISSARPRKESSPKLPAPAHESNQKRKLAGAALEATSDLEEGEIPLDAISDMEEGEIPSREPKKRRIKFDASPVVKKASENQKNVIDPWTSDRNQESQASHKRKATSSFSLDDGRPSKRFAAAIPITRPLFDTNTTTPAPKLNVSKECKLFSDPAILPDDKEGLCREYGRYFAHYLHTMSKFYAQKSKVEAALALNDGAESTAEGDSDLMDSKELTKLCEEFHRTRNEMERIQKAHQNLNANAI